MADYNDYFDGDAAETDENKQAEETPEQREAKEIEGQTIGKRGNGLRKVMGRDEDDSIARDLMELQSTGKRVTLTYKEYRGALPWRGSSKIIVTGYRVK